MGVFNRRKNDGSGGGGPPQRATITESVRKADGSIVHETIVEFPEKIDSEYMDEKQQYSVNSYPVSPTREDSVSGNVTTKHQSRAAIIEDLVPGYDENEDNYAPSLHIRRKWRSHRLAPGEVYEKPWKEEKIPRRSWERVIFALGCIVGCIVGGYLVYSAWASVTNDEYCLILDDHFSNIDTDVWNYEVERGGFGTGSFDWTTTDSRNIYVDNAGLHIIPTLTTETTNITEAQMLNGAVLNLTTAGTCTSDTISDCSIRSNATSGTMINPVRSARINTKGKRSLRYGKVEVVAKIPQGDWLWPAIWMMPEDDVYGTWPQSGEIDIMEARGNAAPFPGGRNQVSSTLHWGPNQADDAYWRTMGLYSLPRTDYSEEFHTYGLEWSGKYLFCYLDSRLRVGFSVQQAHGDV